MAHHSRRLGEQPVDVRPPAHELCPLPTDKRAELGVGVHDLSRPSPDRSRGGRIRDELLQLLRGASVLD